MKKYLVITLLLFFSVCLRAQTITFPDMADMVNLSIEQVDNILINTGKFKLNSKEEVNGQIIIKYQTMNKNKQVIKGETVVTGAYRTAGDGNKLRTITYMSVYPEYIENLMKQILKFGYRTTFKGADQQRKIYIYDNALNHVTVTFKADHSMNSVEIRQKDIGVEP